MVRRAPPLQHQTGFHRKRPLLSDGAGGARTRPDLFFSGYHKTAEKGISESPVKKLSNFLFFYLFCISLWYHIVNREKVF